MKSLRHSLFVPLWLVATCCTAAERGDCFTEEVEAHVIEQMLIHGPLSKDREYFGLIYRHAGNIESATIRGGRCRSGEVCEVNSARAAAKVPKGAKVLGEWHTHPREFPAETLSPTDVRGANANRHIRCYRAFFGTSKGQIFTWDTNASAVIAAMDSKVLLGNYRHPEALPANKPRDPDANVIAGR